MRQVFDRLVDRILEKMIEHLDLDQRQGRKSSIWQGKFDCFYQSFSLLDFKINDEVVIFQAILCRTPPIINPRAVFVDSVEYKESASLIGM